MIEEKASRLAQDVYNVSLYGRNAAFVRALFNFLLRAAGGKAFAAQYRSSARRLEGHVVGFAALVAGDFKALAFAAPCTSSSATEIGPTAIAASLTTLRLAQISLRVILLLTFGEWELCAALGASDLYVWHVCFSLWKALREDLRLSSLSKGLALVRWNPFPDCDRHRARTISSSFALEMLRHDISHPEAF